MYNKKIKKGSSRLLRPSHSFLTNVSVLQEAQPLQLQSLRISARNQVVLALVLA